MQFNLSTCTSPPPLRCSRLELVLKGHLLTAGSSVTQRASTFFCDVLMFHCKTGSRHQCFSLFLESRFTMRSVCMTECITQFFSIILLTADNLTLKRTVLFVRFQVLTATSVKFRVFWDVAPCSLVETLTDISEVHSFVLHFTHWVPLWVSYDSRTKQRLFL
jgi:hypothetical protein